MIKFVFIVGSYPPDICGVGDYTFKLLHSDTAIGNHWEVFYRRDWSLGKLFRYIKDINALKPSHLFLQYPTQGYGWSLLPHILCIYFSLFTKIKFVSVLHEFSNASPKNRLAEKLFIFSSNAIVVTNDFEKQNVQKAIPFKKDIRIIRISSNISGSKVLKTYSERDWYLIYFGHIRPNKGVEEFLNFVEEHINVLRGKRIAIIGQIPKEFKTFYKIIKVKAEELNIELIHNLPDIELSKFLNNTKFAYLPFPDGISERRGSFLACAFNGVNVISTEGKYTTKELKECVYIANTQSDIINYLDSMNSSSYNDYQDRLYKYIKEVIPSSWDDVANKYLELI